MEESKENEDILQLGDTLIILGGTLTGTRGKVYFVNDELIRIMPMGVSNRLIDIPIVDGDFDPSLDIGDGDINYVKASWQ